MYRDVDPEEFLKIVAAEMQIDVDAFRKSKRIAKAQRDQRDLLIYLLRESGRFSNNEIGSLLGMSYSNVSRRINQIRYRLEKDKGLMAKYRKISAQINV